MKYCLCEAPTREHDMSSDFDVRFGSGADFQRSPQQCPLIAKSGLSATEPDTGKLTAKKS